MATRLTTVSRSLGTDQQYGSLGQNGVDDLASTHYSQKVHTLESHNQVITSQNVLYGLSKFMILW